MKVPHYKYKVYAWDEDNKIWLDAEYQIFCNTVRLENGYEINDCDLHVKKDVYPLHYAYLLIEYDEDVEPHYGNFDKISFMKHGKDGSLIRFKLNEDEDYYFYV